MRYDSLLYANIDLLLLNMKSGAPYCKPLQWLSLMAATLVLVISCQHEPYPAPPGMAGTDTTGTPGNDTTGNGTARPCHPDTVYYGRDIQPILTASCAYAGCHGQGSSQDGVSLESYQSVMNANVVDPFDPSSSDLVEVLLETDPDKKMPPPPNNPLENAKIQLIQKWIRQGAQNLSCDDCDTSYLRYNDQIRNLVAQNCTACHGGANPSAGRSLDSYAALKDAFLNTNLRARINAASSVPVMPPGGKMNNCNIGQLEKWYQDGMPQ